jgi:TPR repeat protein
MLKWIAALVVLLPAIAHAGFDEAVAAYAAGDYATAMKEFRQLSEQGDVPATYYVGFLYRQGYGVPIDQAEAAKWFRKAAARGDSQSQYYLGKMAEKGEGMDRDLAVAHMWFSLSAKNAPNPRDAAYTREEIKKLERKMTPEQLSKAKELASAWKPG